VILTPQARRKKAYQGLFGDGSHGEGKAVLADLKRFAQHPDAPIIRDLNGAVDPIASARLVGRQEMFNRILAFIHLDDRTLFNLREETDTDE
jgi:hypothetical protein